jgi:hypothetical protein
MKYEVKMSLLEMTEKGRKKRVSHLFLVEALSIVEAVAKATKEEAQYGAEELDCLAGKAVNYTDVILSKDAEKFYKVKVSYMDSIGEDLKEKKVSQYFIVQAETLDAAKKIIEEGISTWMVEAYIESINETSIYDYISE